MIPVAEKVDEDACRAVCSDVVIHRSFEFAIHAIVGQVLLVIVPTTLEGRRALLQHLVQRDEDGIYEPIGELAAKMLRLPMFAQGEART